MLEKIIKLDGVGIFHNGTPTARDLAKLTLIYADNARGKSTLSALLRAVATGDTVALTSRATIGGTRPAAVHLRFRDPAGGRTVKFENGGWDGKAPQVHVFDNAFVENNVYAAGEVGTGQHEALLDFALGTAAVDKRLEVEKQGVAQAASTRARTDAENKLSGHRGAMPLPVFLNLAKDDEADAKIEALERRINNAREAATIGTRASLKVASLAAVSWDPFETVLGASVEKLQEGANELVESHFRRHGWRGIEGWVAQGLRGKEVTRLDECSFCGQSTQGLALVAAYQTYFNTAYNDHMTAVGGLRGLATSVLPRPDIEAWAAAVAANGDRAGAWKPQLELNVDGPDFESVHALAGTVRDTLLQAAEKKAAAPLDAMDVSALEPARAAVAELGALLQQYNDRVAEANKSIEEFKKGLATENVQTLQAQVASLKLQKTRHSDAVVTLVAERVQADENRKTAEAAKEQARQELNQLMKDLLTRYQAAINKWLGIFGAPFSIDNMGVTYQGSSTPRTEYAIVLRKTRVQAGKKTVNGLNFQNALSEGDKRTLALAVFLARVQDDQNAARATVVLDDIFASLDQHRRVTTMSAIAALAQSCAQLIILAHDPFFLRDLAAGLKKKRLGEALCLQIRRSQDEFSELDVCDLAEKCRSPFHTRYKELSDYMAGQRAGQNPLRLAESLRPLVEGALHRRFPGLIREGNTFGEILEQIRTALAGSPLEPLQAQLPNFHSFNDYAGAYHHDTFDVQPRQDVNEGELEIFGRRTLEFIHHGRI
jgi:wobble nucleotide-excising tRNase